MSRDGLAKPRQTYTYVRLQLLPHGTPTVMGLSAVCSLSLRALQLRTEA